VEITSDAANKELVHIVRSHDTVHDQGIADPLIQSVETTLYRVIGPDYAGAVLQLGRFQRGAEISGSSQTATGRPASFSVPADSGIPAYKKQMLVFQIARGDAEISELSSKDGTGPYAVRISQMRAPPAASALLIGIKPDAPAQLLTVPFGQLRDEARESAAPEAELIGAAPFSTPTSSSCPRVSAYSGFSGRPC
jgi:hypothetical protein